MSALDSRAWMTAARIALVSRVGIVLAAALQLSACQFPWQEESGNGALDLPGTVDAREVPLSFQVGGRLQALHVDEGSAVQVGQSIAELDPADYQLAVERAEAQSRAAAMVLATLKAGARTQELRVAEAAVKQAEAELQFADSDVRRTDKLIAQKLAAPEQQDQAQLKYNVATSKLAQARHSLALLRAGARKEEIDRAKAELAASEAALATARRQLDYTHLSSPVSGVVSLRQAEEGQVVVAGQSVLRVTELAKPWVRAYLRETDLPRVKLGEPVQVRVDGLPDKTFQGHLTFVAPQAEFTPKTVETRALRVDLVYEIKVEVENPEGQLKVGMPADLIFNSGS